MQNVECNRCISGREVSLSVTRWHIQWSMSGMGVSPACRSSTSVAVVYIAPVIAMAAICWIEISLLVMQTEPKHLLAPSFLRVGVYQMSAA